MQNWYNIIPKNRWLSIYAWIIFCLLPFYFIFRLSQVKEIVYGIIMIVLFFSAYRLSFITVGYLVYLWVGIMMALSVSMTIFFGYVYFSLFIAFFIGSINNKAGFFTLYIIHLITTILAVIVCFLTESEQFIGQFPFILITVIGVILLPFNMYNKTKHEQLEGQLEDANEKIAELMVIEERQRIARDLHDTLGQKLSLIGLKSDLAAKLIEKNPERAKQEIIDIQHTARIALKEVREMVSGMRGLRLEEEIERIKQLLFVANIELIVEGNPTLTKTPLYVENVISMCLKEAITNVVKHSEATKCKVTIQETDHEVQVKIIDNGKGMSENHIGNGLRGIQERLEFVNGSLSINNDHGVQLNICVPNIQLQAKRRGE